MKKVPVYATSLPQFHTYIIINIHIYTLGKIIYIYNQIYIKEFSLWRNLYLTGVFSQNYVLLNQPNARVLINPT